MGGVTAPFAPDELARYARHIVLPEIGGVGQARLRRATVALVGAGGIGAPAIQYLAAAGVGRLVLIDDDRVDASNLHRQTIFRTADIGARKVAAAAAAVTAINPHVAVVAHCERLDPANAAMLLRGADVVVDGSDSFATRLTVADAAYAARTPLVSAAVGRFDAQLAVFRGWEPGQPCYRCLVGDSPGNDGMTCADDGVLGPMVGMIGSMAALETVRAITPFGIDPVGRLFIADLLSFGFRTVRLRKETACRTCSGI